MQRSAIIAEVATSNFTSAAPHHRLDCRPLAAQLTTGPLRLLGRVPGLSFLVYLAATAILVVMPTEIKRLSARS